MMPYRVSNRAVQVLRGKKWVLLKKHKTKAEADQHLRALYANVGKGK